MPIQKYDQELVALGVESRHDEFTDKFAINEDSGAFVMKADAMPRRFDPHDVRPLEKVYDDITRGPYGNREWFEEQRLLNRAHMLLAMGIPKPTTQELEDWVAENIERGDSDEYNRYRSRQQ